MRRGVIWPRDSLLLGGRGKEPQERAGNTLEAIGTGKDFLSRTPAAQQLRERMAKWDNMKF
jgi:hypothetical protein